MITKKRKKKTKAPSTEWSNVKSIKLKRLIAERKKRNMNQSDVAAALGVSVSLISHIENGRMKPNADVSIGLEMLFELPYETLFPDY